MGHHVFFYAYFYLHYFQISLQSCYHFLSRLFWPKVGILDFSNRSIEFPFLEYVWPIGKIFCLAEVFLPIIHRLCFGFYLKNQKKIREIDFTEKIFLYVPIHLDCSSVKTLASLLNFTVDFRYWNKIRNWISKYLRKLESLSWSWSKFWLVKYLAKNCSALVSTSFWRRFLFPEITSTL